MSDVLIELGKGLAYVVLGVCAFLASRMRRRTQKAKAIVSSSRVDLAMQDLLAGIRVAIGADRVFLARFHNGDHYVDGSEILKVSRTNESVVAGISYSGREYQDVLISTVPQELKLVLEEGPSFTGTEELGDGKFRRMLSSSGTTAVARCAIRRGSKIIGFVGADWTHAVERPERLQLLVDLAGRLEQMMGG